MQITVPIYVQQRRGRTTTPPISVRPLFFEYPASSGSELGRVIAKLTNKLRVHLAELARKPRHDDLLSWHYPDPIHHKVLKIHLDLRDSTATLRVMMATLRRHGRVLAYSPSLPELWFDVENGESLETRSEEVYRSYFRQRRKEQPDYPIGPHSIEGKAWVDHITIDVLPQREAKKATDPLRRCWGAKTSRMEPHNSARWADVSIGWMLRS